MIINKQEFINQFKEFETNNQIETYLVISFEYFKDIDCSLFLKKRLMYLLLAHFLTLKDRIEKGDTSLNQKNSSSIGSVSVSLNIPTSKDNFDYWLNLSGYGKEILFLLDTIKPSFVYLNGSFQRILE